jgi:hypothetical protein
MSDISTAKQKSAGVFCFVLFFSMPVVISRGDNVICPRHLSLHPRRQASLLLSERRVGHHILVHVDTTANKSKIRSGCPKGALTSTLPERHFTVPIMELELESDLIAQ